MVVLWWFNGGLMELPFGKHDQKSIFMGKSTISIAMFNSYVKLPEGRSCMFISPIKSQIRYQSISILYIFTGIYWEIWEIDWDNMYVYIYTLISHHWDNISHIHIKFPINFPNIFPLEEINS